MSNELAGFARRAGMNITAGKSCSDSHASIGPPILRAWVHDEDSSVVDADETFMIGYPSPEATYVRLYRPPPLGKTGE